MTALGTFACALLFTAAFRAWFEERMGRLPAGADFVLWAYVTGASITALILALWARSRGRGFTLALWIAYAAALAAAMIALGVVLALLYPTGTFVKSAGGITAAGLTLMAGMAVALAGAARLTLGRGASLWLIGAFGVGSVLAFVLSWPLLGVLHSLLLR